MFIPVRLPQNAFDLTRPAREMTPAFGKAGSPRDVLSGPTSTPFFPPALRDVGGELDRMLAGLAPTSQERRSQLALGLGQSNLDRASVLSARAPINVATTSYQKVALAFGSSTSVAQVSGTYRGTGAASAASALTVSLDSSAVMGGTDSAISFHVSDQNGTTLFAYAGTAKAGQAISLGNEIGLALTFGQGSLVAGQSGRTGVSRVLPTKVDENARFNESDLNARPRFESGLSVVPGSFSINGTTIAVKADDSIARVLQRVTEEMPDIVATYKDQTITLTTRDSTRQAIVLSDDTSGFLEATKLLGAQTKLGYLSAQNERLADSARFAAVGAGSFRLGNTTLAVDPQSDTLAGLLARMTAVGLGTGPNRGISAYYNDQNDAVVVRGGDESTTLGDDTSGFLSALGLSSGRPLAARETLILDPATSARLERATAGRQAELVEQTFSGPAFQAAPPAANDDGSNAAGPANKPSAPGALGSARKAKAAYGREVDESLRKPSKDASSSGLGIWGKTWPPGSAPNAGAIAALPTSDDAGDAQAAG